MKSVALPLVTLVALAVQPASTKAGVIAEYGIIAEYRGGTGLRTSGLRARTSFTTPDDGTPDVLELFAWLYTDGTTSVGNQNVFLLSQKSNGKPVDRSNSAPGCLAASDEPISTLQARALKWR